MVAHEIAFEATVNKVQTLADGGIRVTFDLSETAITEAALLMECKRQGAILRTYCKTEDSNAIQKRAVRKSSRRSAEEQGVDKDTGGGGEQDGDADGWPESGEETDYS